MIEPVDLVTELRALRQIAAALDVQNATLSRIEATIAELVNLCRHAAGEPVPYAGEIE